MHRVFAGRVNENEFKIINKRNQNKDERPVERQSTPVERPVER
jgi:hypothetical protein